jgi:hypothetical protein
MYMLNVNSARSYIDGSLIPKLAANVSAYWRNDDDPETIDGIDIEGNPVKIPYEGQLLLTMEMAVPVSEVAAVVSGKDPEEAKAALNEYVLSIARNNPVMNLDALEKTKVRVDQEEAALEACNQAIAVLDTLVIYPARIPYTE